MHCVFERRAERALHTTGILAVAIITGTGCLADFNERSFKMNPDDSVRLSRADEEPPVRSTRAWLRDAHQQLAGLLPEEPAPPLLTEQMVKSDGNAVDVFAHFSIDPAKLQSLVQNFRGLRYSAQAASRDYYIDKPAPAWPGFDDVWIPITMPINDVCVLNGRMAYARDRHGNVRDADCIVVLPGLFGDHGVKRSRDICIALRDYGFHVLHLEPRGHGQSEKFYPRMYNTFGILESDDMIQVADWLQSRPHVRRTGLIGYCWNANIALLAAWYEGRRTDDPSISAAVNSYLVTPPDPERRRYEAGIIAFSPVVRWEVLMDELDRERSRWHHPIFAAIQDTIRDRMKLKGYPEQTGNLRNLVEYEYRGYGVPLPHGSREGYPFLRLIPYRDQPAGDKLEYARMPVLIVQAVDDPLVPAQDIADLMAMVHNPRVAAVILASGGHVGFAGYCPQYYLSLITNFFDPNHGPAAGNGQAASTAMNR